MLQMQLSRSETKSKKKDTTRRTNNELSRLRCEVYNLLKCIIFLCIMYTYFFSYLSYSVSLDESRNPLANGFESILSLVISWFWYAVTAVKTVSGKTNVLWSSSSSCFGVVGILRPGGKRTKWIRGW